MLIYKYYQNKWWESFKESIKGKKDSKELIEDYIIHNGKLISLQEYFSDPNRNLYYVTKDYEYYCYGKPNNALERLAYSEIKYDPDLYYCDLLKNSPEDLCESRTNWGNLKDYADGLVSFINQLKEEIAQNIIKL